MLEFGLTLNREKKNQLLVNSVLSSISALGLLVTTVWLASHLIGSVCGYGWALSAHVVSLSYFFVVNTLPRVVVVSGHLVFCDVVQVASPEFGDGPESRFDWLVGSVSHFY